MQLIHTKTTEPFARRPRIAIAVRLKNERKFLPALIASLQGQTVRHDCELVFLDSGSTDGSIDYLRDYADRIYAIAPSEFQFGRSCNQIVSQCVAPFVVLLSAHVIVTEPDALEVAVTALERNAALGAVYLRQKTDGVPNQDFSNYESLFLKKRFPVSNLDMTAESMPPAAPVSNAAAVIRRSVWEGTPFPEVQASEDVLWARTIVQQGLAVRYLGERSIVHNHSETADQIYRRVRMNKIAQNGTRPQYRKALLYFAGIFGALLYVERASLSTSFHYAKAHATAYIK
jgi:GT2 family glycosyltransferase